MQVHSERKVYEVAFTYERIVTVYLEAENEDELHDFLEETDWDPLVDGPEIIDSDDTNEPAEEYSVERARGCTANYRLDHGHIVEVES